MSVITSNTVLPERTGDTDRLAALEAIAAAWPETMTAFRMALLAPLLPNLDVLTRDDYLNEAARIWLEADYIRDGQYDWADLMLNYLDRLPDEERAALLTEAQAISAAEDVARGVARAVLAGALAGDADAAERAA